MNCGNLPNALFWSGGEIKYYLLLKIYVWFWYSSATAKHYFLENYCIFRLPPWYFMLYYIDVQFCTEEAFFKLSMYLCVSPFIEILCHCRDFETLND